MRWGVRMKDRTTATCLIVTLLALLAIYYAEDRYSTPRCEDFGLVTGDTIIDLSGVTINGKIQPKRITTICNNQ